MAAFSWQALDGGGRLRQGVMEGESPRLLRQRLRSQGLTPVSVEELEGKAVPREAGERRRSSVDRRQRPVDLALLTRQLATLLRSRLPVEEALRIVAEQSVRHSQRNLVHALRAAVAEGSSLADAIRRFPRAFPDYFAANVAAGEQSGRLEDVLERLADYTENAASNRQEILMKLLYPALVALVALAVVIGLVTYVVPEVIRVFERMDQQLPVLTRGLIALSDFLRDYGVWLVLLLLLCWAVLQWLYARPASRRHIHRLVLRVPLLGNLVRDLNISRFARTFGILLGSSVSATEALRISARVLTNLPMREALADAADRVREGTAIGAALSATDYFPPLMLNMIASGEASGRLVEMLERAADAQERQLLTRVSTAVGLLEPLMILVMGGVVLAIVMAILLPIFDINQMIQ
ncbi:MAG: type II secretion system inner membrane protein GspF [Pseudomonadota bacterium]